MMSDAAPNAVILSAAKNLSCALFALAARRETLRSAQGDPFAVGIVMLAIVAALAGCRAGADTPQGTAERFVDAHYVDIDLAAAKPFCVGPALAKVEEEQRLTSGQVIDESTRKPRVHYSLLEKKEDGADRVSFMFEGSIRVEDAGTFTRKWMVTTRKEADGWRVSNFDEFE
jgi:hypothetical protein